MRRLFASTALALTALPAALSAQERVTLWDVFSPDRIVQSFLHTGIQMIRTQMDVQYGDLSVDLRRSRITMSDITAWPFLDWDESGDCQIDIDRITVLTTPIDLTDRFKATARLSGVSADKACFPEDVHQAFDMAALDSLDVPRLTVDFDYGMPKSDATVRVYADVDGVATVDATGAFSYFWFEADDDLDDPYPVWFLESAVLSVENKGLWEAVQPVLPPNLTGENAGAAVQGMLEGLFADVDAGGLNDAQRAFIASAAAVWPDFVAQPETLVLETALDEDVYLDFYAMEDDFGEVFTLLKPVAALAPARVSAAVPVDLLSRATGEGVAELSDDEKRTVGAALMTGEGAPRNVEAGLALLQPLAEGGDGTAALTLAEALEVRAPEDAYLWALRAGRAGEAGAVALLDRLEDDIPLARVLELQDEVSGSDSHPGSALRTIAGIREQAAMRMSGKGAARSYGIAAMWAMLAKAAGDPEAADILEEIDTMVRLEGAAGRDAWAETEAGYAKLAMEVWIGQNLPARYAE
ncbi:hypothetical protein P1J78_09250 [Psychromarinibacter sp. C21-152]|uniref:Uncharacterized protein n=1 Tax=Psychromarinibacter sediminicola TaxID=3033385 RepID=A0AAE3NRY5_9RHOB|nr:hypothetical protein [Psychromarinibacter sediminicola]MDF0600916.1 hypothetical protein [Psychromarinibacter sediminicola]